MAFALQAILTAIGSLGRAANSAPVTLGPVVLSGFEAPSGLGFPGEQTMSIRPLPGGGRDIQVTGYQPGPLEIAGMFIGPSALQRARLIEAMLIQGLPIPFSAAGRRYTVLVRRFRPEVRMVGAVVPYTLTLEVLPVPQLAPVGPGGALASLVGPNIASALTAVGDTASQVAGFASSAVGLVQSTVAQVAPIASLVGLGLPLAHITDQLTQAQAITSAGINLAAAPAAVAGLVGGLQAAASGLGGVIGISTQALGQIAGATPSGSLLPADPAQVVAATGHVLALAGATQALGSVNSAIVGAQAAAGGTVVYPGSIGGGA